MRALSVKSECADPCGFDFRTRLLASLAFSTVTVYLSDGRILAALSAATFAYLVASTRRYGLVAAAYALMGAMSLLSIAVVWGSYTLLGALLAGTRAAARFAQMRESVLGDFHTPFLRMLPSMNVMLALVLNLSVQKFTGTLKALRMPRVVFLPLLVFCRFVPEFVDVVRQLRDAVRMRGFSVTFGSALAHPFQTVRLTVVPLAVRTLRMADNLAMAAEMRRVGYAARPTHLAASALRRRDWLAMCATAALTAAVALWQSALPQKPSAVSRGAAAQERSK